MHGHLNVKLSYWYQTKPDKMWEKRKNNFAFCAAGDAGEKGAFLSILNLKYFI